MMVYSSRSLWSETATSDSPRHILTGSHRADVVIIGAGFTGLRAALELSESGLSVVVLEAGDVAHVASGSSGGQGNPIPPFNTPSQFRKLLGTEYAERLTNTYIHSADDLFATIKKYQIDCQARQNGWLRVFHSAKALRKEEVCVKEWNDHGAGIEFVGGSEIERKSGTSAYHSGIITPQGGAVQPLSLSRGLAKAAEQRGVKIYSKSAVLSLDKSEGKWTAKTSIGSVLSDWVIIATNGYTGDLIPGLSKSIIPIASIQIATDPLPEETIGSILPEGHTISDSRRVIMIARREPDNRIVYGSHGREFGNDTIGGVEWLIKDAERVFPQLRGVNWSYRWGGSVALTEDRLPHLHEPKPGLLVGFGYNGRGVAISNIMGKVLAKRVLGANPNELPFPTSPIMKIPFRSLKKTLEGPAIWFLRLLDYLESR